MFAIGDPRTHRKAWNYKEVADVWRMLHLVPGFVHQIQKLEAMVMCKPFKVVINSMPLEQQKEMQYLTRTIWMRNMKRVLLWKFGLGIVPYYESPLEGTAHRIPYTPDITQGTLYTYQGANRVQIFEWEWNNSISKFYEKPQIKWLYTGNEPDLYGNIRTSVMACIEKFRMLEKARQDALYANFHLSHPVNIYEDRPPVNARENNFVEYNVINLGQEDDTSAAIDDYARDQVRRGQEKIRMARTQELDEQLKRSGFISDSEGFSRYKGPVLYTDSIAEDFDRERYLHTRITLPTDRHYVGSPKPGVLLNIEELDKSLTRDAAEIVGIPAELTQNDSNQHAPNRVGVMMTTTETLKANIKWMNEALTQMYTGIYGETIRNDWNRMTNSGEIRLYAARRFRTANGELKYEMGLCGEVDIQVELQCDPAVSVGQIMQFYSSGFMTKERAVEQLTAITGLPEGVLEALEEELEIVDTGEQGKTGEMLESTKDTNEIGGGSGQDNQKRRKIVIAEHSRFIKDHSKKK